ncbi:MAG: tetratricopeptide repeat protein [Bauldia sp.]
MRGLSAVSALVLSVSTSAGAVAAGAASPAERPALPPLVLLAQAAPAAVDIPALIEKAAAGDGRAQMDLGWRYHEGDGVPKDYAKAADLLQKAADQRFAVAMVRLGTLYELGHGVPANAATAVTWYRKAADAGVAAGQYEVARTYLEGIGVEKNPSLAAGWFRRAADGGHAGAAFAYSRALIRGEGIPQDLIEAYARLLEALAFPDAPPEAQSELDLLRPYLNADQLTAANRRAATLPKPKP